MESDPDAQRTPTGKAEKKRPEQLKHARPPFLFANLAITADGKIASANRKVTTFGSAWDERHLYQLRSTADAILCGARTIEQAHSTLGNGPESWTRRRLRSGMEQYPVRVVVSGTGSISPDAELWSCPFGPVVVVTTSKAPKSRLTWLRRHAAAVWGAETDTIDWAQCLAWLGREFGVHRALSEGGGELNEALFRAGLVRELHLTWCPWLLGGRSAPTLADGRGVPTLEKAIAGTLVRCRRVGREVSLVYRF